MTLPSSQPTALLFDWDNTLVDTWPVIHEALTHTFVQMGVAPWSMEETKERVHRSMRDAFPDIFGDRWEEAGALYQQRFRAIHLERLSPLPGAESVLQRLRTQSFFLGVVSNKTNVNLVKEVRHLGWNHYFDVVVGAQDAPRDKPFADPILHALAGTDLSPGPHVWLIGDSVTDLECAKNAGITAVFFGAERAEAPAMIQAYQPTYWVKDHAGFFATTGLQR